MTERCLSWARRWFDSRIVSNVFEPLVADWQRELIDASRARRGWIQVRGAAAFIATAIAIAPRQIFFAPVPATVARRVLSRPIIFLSVMSLPLLTMYVLDMRYLPPLQIASLVWWLLPSIVVAAFPFVAIVIADAIRRHAAPTREERTQALRVAVAAALVMFAVHGWIVPAANQQFRIGMSEYRAARPLDPRQHPPRGIRELTTYELIFESANATASEPPLPRATMLNRELHTRFSFAVLPLVLVWLRWLTLGGATDRWRKPLPALLSIAGLSIAYGIMQMGVETLGFGPAAGVWFPVFTFWMAGISGVQIRKLIPT